MNRPSQNLVPVSVRLPQELVDQLKTEAVESDRTLADIFRLHIVSDIVKPLDKSRRHPRQKKPSMELSDSDRATLAELRRIGSSLNQIAVVCHRWPVEVASKALRRVGALNRDMNKALELLCTKNS